MQELGKIIKEYREKKNLSQCELAKKAKLSQSIISCLENGIIKDLRFKKLIKVAEVLDINLEAIK